jgi:tetratricopeptide (TPR) repeat protein
MLLAAQGRTEEAIASLQTSEEALRTILSKEPTNRVWQRERSIADLQIAKIHASTGKQKDALEKTRTAESNLVELSNLDKKNSDIARGLALAAYLQALIAVKDGDLRTAEAAANKSEEILNGVDDKLRTDKFVSAELAQAMLLKARIFSQRGDSDAAAKLCKTTIQNLSAIIGKERDFRVADPWVRANICTGNLASVSHIVAFMQQVGYNEAEYRSIVNQ